jgi:hypothetical protein
MIFVYISTDKVNVGEQFMKKRVKLDDIAKIVGLSKNGGIACHAGRRIRQ